MELFRRLPTTVNAVLVLVLVLVTILFPIFTIFVSMARKITKLWSMNRNLKPVIGEYRVVLI